MRNRTIHVNSLWCWVLVAGLIGLRGGSLDAAGPASDTSQESVGRNPFAALLSPSAPPEPERVAMPELTEPLDLRLGTIVLKFLDAKSLKGVVDRMVSPFGSVAVNEKTNSVIVCDTPENLARIMGEIKKIDQTPSQIMVEVIILDVQLRDGTEVGVNWDLLSTGLEDFAYRQSLSSSRLFAVPPSTTSTTGASDNLANATAFNSVGFGGDFSVISGSVRHVLHMIQQKRNAEILASPRVLVVSGRSATIKAVEEIPYQEVIDTATGGANAMTSTEFKEVGITLQVEATITDGNNILLTVQTVQNMTTGLSTTGIPIVDTREASTVLLLVDGQTVVFGGLRREEKSKRIDQIPILGDLPLIGALFKSVTTSVAHSELVVLLSPRIHRGEPIPGEVAAKIDGMQARSPLKTQVVVEPATIGSPEADPKQE